MKITKVIAALVFGLFLTLSSVVGVSAQDDTMKTKQTNMTMKAKPHHHHKMMKRHHKMKAKHHRKMMKHHHMMKKTTMTKTT